LYTQYPVYSCFIEADNDLSVDVGLGHTLLAGTANEFLGHTGILGNIDIGESDSVPAQVGL
jgi:hypothetical protein